MLSRVTLVASVASAFLALVACSAKSNHPPATESSSSGIAGGGGGSSGVASDGGLVDGGNGCTTLALDQATIIGQQQIAEAAPVPTGGAIPDGTYVLTKDTIFTGPGGTTAATGVTTQEIQSFNGTAFAVLTQAAAPAAATSASGTFAVSSVTNDAGTPIGSTLTITLACPTPATLTRNYSVVNTTILEFIGSNEVLTYTFLQ